MLRSAAGSAEGRAATRLHEAVDALDSIVHDLQVAAFEHAGTVGRMPTDDGTEQRALRSLFDAERLLVARWNACTGDQVTDADHTDRLVRAARLVHAAMQSLQPGAVA